MLPYKKKQTNSYITLLLLCLLIAMVSGCASATNSGKSKTDYKSMTSSERRIIESTAEEVVEAPELPVDDGIPLTQAEKIALHSTGELDRYLTLEQKQQVEMHFKRFLHKGRKRFTNYLERAQLYTPLVKTIFREMGVPDDIAYLAIVESGFNPNAVSYAGATGMWQFMRYTGKRYGLAQNVWIDERRDPYKATVAAALYLNQLYEHFGDWLLAIAAYNAGEGKIMRAMESTGAADFFELCLLNDNIQENKRKLREETQQYVPTFLAVVKIMRNLELLGFDTTPFETSEEMTTLRLTPGTNLQELASVSGLKFETFKALNPQFQKSVSSPSSYSTAYIPVRMEEKAVAWLNTPRPVVAVKEASTQQYSSYKVKSGDTLTGIASKFKTSVTALKQRNRLSSNKLKIGMVLKVPANKAVAVSSKNNVNSVTPPASKVVKPVAQQVSTAGDGVHTVKNGETLFSISRAYNITVGQLTAANNIKSNDNKISIGQKLKIPSNTASSKQEAKQVTKPQAKLAVAPKPTASEARASTQSSQRVHTVVGGETLYSLANTYKIKLSDLRKANGMDEKSVLKIGQKLIIP